MHWVYKIDMIWDNNIVMYQKYSGVDYDLILTYEVNNIRIKQTW